VTRPEPGTAETAARVAALGWTPVAAPALVLTTRPAVRLPSAVQAILLPSRTAARALPAETVAAGPPALAVGEATAAEARRRGLREVAAAGGDAEALAALAAERLDPRAGPLLLAVGEGYGGGLAAALRGRGFRVLRRIVYTAAPAAALPAAAHAALSGGAVAAALFFSPRSASATISLLKDAGLAATLARMEALAISPRVGRTLAQVAAEAGCPAWRRIRVAARPDQESLLALLGPRHGTPGRQETTAETTAGTTTTTSAGPT
jgi:uroporphyrinogen-III synthase